MKRYTCGGGRIAPYEWEHGEWVTFSDHEAALAQSAQLYAAAALERDEAVAEQIRVEAERDAAVSEVERRFGIGGELIAARRERDAAVARNTLLEGLLRQAEADIYWANVVLKERIRAALGEEK